VRGRSDQTIVTEMCSASSLVLMNVNQTKMKSEVSTALMLRIWVFEVVTLSSRVID
jgi:hypothetical protein